MGRVDALDSPSPIYASLTEIRGLLSSEQEKKLVDLLEYEAFENPNYKNGRDLYLALLNSTEWPTRPEIHKLVAERLKEALLELSGRELGRMLQRIVEANQFLEMKVELDWPGILERLAADPKGVYATQQLLVSLNETQKRKAFDQLFSIVRIDQPYKRSLVEPTFDLIYKLVESQPSLLDRERFELLCSDWESSLNGTRQDYQYRYMRWIALSAKGQSEKRKGEMVRRVLRSLDSKQFEPDWDVRENFSCDQLSFGPGIVRTSSE
ncbi:MAG: hypothetical protein AAF394_07220 [Planctomycetota bacterium]